MAESPQPTQKLFMGEIQALHRDKTSSSSKGRTPTILEYTRPSE
ncbi:MAG: hypothetical protein NTY13_01070 [Chlamydiae bacterium]|nr:hypothetical protein [Chlamydiota bacterium]